MTYRTVTVVSARTTIGAVLLGVPAVLVLLAGNPLPSRAQWTAIVRLEPDWGNSVLLGNVLPCLAWIAWAPFAYPLVAELLRHQTGRSILPMAALLRGQQQVAAALVGAALLSSSSALAASTAAPTIRTDRIIETQDAEQQVDVAAHYTPATTQHFTLAAQAAQSTDRSVSTYEVREGDTLWGIAKRRLGDGRKYPAIVDQSTEIVQPDGRHLTDPNLILPGWNLEIPTTRATEPPVPPAHRIPQPSTPAATPAPRSAPPTPFTPESPSADSDESAGVDVDRAETARDAEVAPVAIVGGVAAILAAGLVAALTTRRRRLQKRRRFGERLAIPTDGPAYDTETQLRAVSDPVALADLHRALASVYAAASAESTPLPRLFAVRIDDIDITVYLHEAATMPSPFMPLFGDGTAWAAPRDAFVADDEPHAVAPYPALVTVGTDLDGGLLLLDLEQQSCLAVVSSDGTTARGVLNAIAAELTSVPWGQDIHLSLVGVPEQLAQELDPYRIDRVPDTKTLIRDIRVHLADRRAALEASRVPDARNARLLAAEVESWAPFIVVVGTQPTLDEQTQLEDLVRQHASTGLVIVIVQDPGTGSGFAEIDISDASAAMYRSNDPTLPLLPFVPQLLDERALEQVLQLFTPSPVADLRAPQPAAPSATDDELFVEVVDVLAEVTDLGRGALHGPALVAMTPSSELFSLDQQYTAASDSEVLAPYLRLLGQVEIEHVDRPELVPGRGIELLTYLLHHRQPLAGTQIQKALWPSSYDRTNGNLRSLAKQVRAALGHDPEGHLWLPEGRGNAGFTTHPGVRSDWQDFLQLTGPDPSAIPTRELATALGLVHGQPLLGTDGHRGRWAWRGPLEETIISTIQDVASIVAARAIEEEDRSLVKAAARAARFVDRYSELSWQIELRGAIPRATPAEVERIVADLYATAGHGNPDYEPDTETIMLIQTARAASGKRRP